MITSQGERDREGRMAEERRDTESLPEGERGGRMSANVLKEIAGMSFLGWNSSDGFGQTRGNRISVTPGLMQAVAGRKGGGDRALERGRGMEWV